MRILLSGQSGFIGKCVYKKLISESNSDDITVIDLRQKNINLKYSNYDLLIHCASSTPDNTADLNTIMEKNISILNNICNIIDKKNVLKIINLSSMSVYGRDADGYIDENVISKNPDTYGLSKIYTENYINTRYKNKLGILHLRLPGVTGKVENNIFLNRLYKKIKNDGCILIDDPNALFNNILDIDDLVNYIIKNKRFDNSNKNNELTLNLGSKYPITLKEVVELFFNKLEKKINIQMSNQTQKHFYINIDKAKENGFKPLKTEDAIIKFISSKG